MASDLSKIIKDELSNTLEQLLSRSSSINNVTKADFDKLTSSQCIESSVKFDFKDISSKWKFYIPTNTATKFEYLMLGGMGDLKEHIDDEITDAVNEIISNVCGSITTAVNAQGFPDVSGIKNEMQGSSIVECSSCKEQNNIFEVELMLGDDELLILLAFDDIILPFVSEITGKESSSAANSFLNEPEAPSSFDSFSSMAQPTTSSSSEPSVNALLSNESAKNLKLLFDIKLKLSVRLGTKIFLLKDILRWDVGEIIELEQMVNEPLEILVNGVKIGEGEAVIVEGKFGLKIKSIGENSTRLSQIGL